MQSNGITDSIIFAVAPLGVITAVVGAIRVGGSKAMAATIGRAGEGRAAAEVELMSSTSGDIYEYWDGRVVRERGKSPIIELVYVVPDGLDESENSILLRKWEDDVGIYDSKSARSLSNGDSLLELASSHPDQLVRDIKDAPNLTLNTGSHLVSSLELWCVALFGIMLQSGVIVYAMFSGFLSSWNSRFQRQGYEATFYAPLMACGTVTLVIGMFLCSHVIERSTVQHWWKIKEQQGARVRVAWLQKGDLGGKLLDSYAIFPFGDKSSIPVFRPFLINLCGGEARWEAFKTKIKTCYGKHGDPVFGRACRFLSSLVRRVLGPGLHVVQGAFGRSHRWNPQYILRACRSKERKQEEFAAFAVLISFSGFVIQFLGLRGLHWSVTVAQLGATLCMTILRVWVRRNLLFEPPTKKIENGYELEWMARDIKRCDHWSVITWGLDQPPSSYGLATSVMAARRRLATLSKWPGHWQSAVKSTTEAIAASMNFLHSGGYFTSERDWSTLDRFEWKMAVEAGVNKEYHVGEITLTLKRSRLLNGSWGPWRAMESEVEAVLGLWMLHFKDQEPCVGGEEPPCHERNGDWQRDEETPPSGKTILRVLGPYDELARMNYECWIVRQTRHVRVENVQEFTHGDGKKCDLVIGGLNSSPKTPVLGVITNTALEKVCGQVIFAEFMSSISAHVTMTGEVHPRESDKGVKYSFGLDCPDLAELVKVVEQTNLVNTEEAYMSIVPALGRHGGLPVGPGDTEKLFADIVEAANMHTEQGRLEQAERFLLWLFYCAETTANIYKNWRDWKKAGEIYSNLRRVCEDISSPDEYIKEADTRISLFCESVFTFIAAEARNENYPTRFSDTLGLVSRCMTEVFGEIPETTLEKWKTTNLVEFQPKMTKEAQLQQAATDGRNFLVEKLLEGGVDVNSCGRNSRTSLVLACIAGHAVVVEQLIKRGANPNIQDYHGRTPLHYASEKGHTSAVQTLLLCEGLMVDIRDKEGQTPLDLAIKNHVGAVVNLLSFHGAEDLSGEASKLLRESSRKGSDAAVNVLLLEPENIDIPDTEYLRTPVHWSVWKGSAVGLERLLSNKADIQVKDKLGNTPLHFAAINGSLSMLEILLDRGADIKAEDNKMRTALYQAAEVGHEAIVLLLLDRGADVLAKDSSGDTPLHRAASMGHEVIVQLLLERGADVRAGNSDGDTPLHRAASAGHEVIVRLLLKRRAGIAVETVTGKSTPLHQAAYAGHETIARLLLDQGADVLAKDSGGDTPLHRATSAGHEAVVRLLLDRGANTMEENDGGGTPLHRAASMGHEAILRLLLDRKADIMARDCNGDTPLHVAAYNGHEGTVQLLLDRKADIMAENNAERTPLHRAAYAGHEQIVGLLLDQRANMMARDYRGDTPLHDAAYNGHRATVQLLLDWGANIMAESKTQCTPLHRAAYAGREPIVRLLLDRKANIIAKDYRGNTPLHDAAYNGNRATVQLLLERGADVMTRNKNEQSALDIARWRLKEEVAELLEDREDPKQHTDDRGEIRMHLQVLGYHIHQGRAFANDNLTV